MSDDYGAAGATYHLCTSLACGVDWADHWQTMVTGILAVTAAVWAIRGDSRREERERARKLASARIRAHFAASELIGFAKEALHLLRLAHDEGLLIEDAPVLPQEAIEIVSTLAEATNDVKGAAYLGELASQAQVLQSRLATTRDPRRLRVISSYALNAARVHAFAEGLLLFARGETVNLPHAIVADRLRSALFLADFDDGAHGEIYEFIDRAIARAEQDNQSTPETNRSRWQRFIDKMSLKPPSPPAAPPPML